MLTLGILGLGEGRSTMSAALNSQKIKLKTICDLNEELGKHRMKEFQFTNLLDWKQIEAEVVGI